MCVDNAVVDSDNEVQPWITPNQLDLSAAGFIFRQLHRRELILINFLSGYMKYHRTTNSIATYVNVP